MSENGNGRRTVMVKLDFELWRRLKAIVYHTGKDRTIQNLSHCAIRRMVNEIEARENNGQPFELLEQAPPAKSPAKKQRK